MQSLAGVHQPDNTYRLMFIADHTPSHSPLLPLSFNTQSCQTDDLNAKSVPSESPNMPFRAKSKMYTFEELNINLDDTDLSDQEKERLNF